MKVAQTSTSSTDAPQSWGPDDDKPVIPKIPGQRTGLGPRPAPPKQRLTARPLAHDLDWDHVQSAAFGTAA